MYRVIDRNGKLTEVEDGCPVPDGCRLHADLRFCDGLSAVQKLVFADSQCGDEDPDDDPEDGEDGEDGEDDAESLTGDQRREILYSRGSRKLSDAEAAAQRCQDAYSNFKSRIDTASGSRRPRDSRKLFEVPAHQKRQPARPGVEKGQSGPFKRDAQSLEALRDKAADAYDARSRRLQDAWKKNKGIGPANAAPTVTPPAWVR